MEPVPEKTLQHGGVERACFLQAGRTKRKTGRGQVRDAQFLLQTNQSGESLLSERKNKGGERERGPWGITPMDPLCMQQELSASPNSQPDLACLCTSGAAILKKKKKIFPFPAKQSEVTNGDVNHSWKRAASILEYPQEDPVSHSANGRWGWEKRDRKGATSWPLKPTWWQLLLSSRKQSAEGFCWLLASLFLHLVLWFTLGIYGDSYFLKDISVRMPISLGSTASIFLSNYSSSQLFPSNF